MPSVRASESPTRRTRTRALRYEFGMVAVIGVAGRSGKASAPPAAASVQGEAATTIDIRPRLETARMQVQKRLRTDRP
jgi:hypothetical protein